MAVAPPSLIPMPAAPGYVDKPVDVVERQPGVGDRRHAGVDGQRERVDHQTSPHL